MCEPAQIEIKLSTDIISFFGTKTQTSLLNTAFTNGYTHKVGESTLCQASFMLMNFMSDNSNHNVGKGPFI